MEETENKQSMQSKKGIIIGILVLVVILAVIFFSKGNKSGSTTEEVIDGVTIEYEDGTTGEGQLVKVNIKAPKLIKKRDIPETMTEEDRAELEHALDLLKDNENDFIAWNAYGVYMFLLEDYTRAEEAWIYASALRPDSSVPSEHLGNLYGYYLGDPVKAEQYLLLAIEQEPVRLALYGRAYEFYRDVMNNEEAGIAIVKQGYEATGDPDFGAFLKERGELE